MNELTAVASFVVLASTVVVAARLGVTALFVLSGTFILLSNITVQMPVVVFGMEISWAIIIYSMVYFITDLLCEYHGRKMGYKLAGTNLAVQIILWAYVWASLQAFPVESGREVYGTMEKLFATTAQITFAAIVAAAGPFLDIYVFTSIRQHWDRLVVVTSEKSVVGRFLRWRYTSLVLRNKLSTFVGQIVNTVLFFSLALLNTGMPTSTVVSIIVTATVVKLAVALFDIPFLVATEKYLHLKRSQT